MTNGFSLTGHAAAADVDLHVELVHELGEDQRLADDHLKGLAGEVIFHFTTVDFDSAVTGIETGTSSSVLATAVP